MSFPTHNIATSQPPWLEPLASTIKFKKRSGLLNWNMVLGLNLDRVIRTRDVNTLHEILASLAYADITLEDISRFSSESILHLLRLNQLELEYMLNVQNFLLSELDKVETVAMEQMEAVDDLNGKAERERQEVLLLRQENASLRDALAREAFERARAQEDLQHARAEARDLRQRHEQFVSLKQKPVALDCSVAAPPHAALTPLPANALLFPCTACDSVFVSDAARLKHHRRRHPDVPLPLAASTVTTRAAPTSANAGLSVFPTQPAQHTTPPPPPPSLHTYPHVHTPTHTRTADTRLQRQHPSPSHTYPPQHSQPCPPLSPSHPHALGYAPYPYPPAPYPPANTDALAGSTHAAAPVETGPFPTPLQHPQTHLQARVAAQMHAHAYPYPHAHPDTGATAPDHVHAPSHTQTHTAIRAGSRGLPEDLSHGSHREPQGMHASIYEHKYRYVYGTGAVGVEAELDALLDDSNTRSAGAGVGASAGAGDMSGVGGLDMLRSAIDSTVSRTLNTPGKPPVPTSDRGFTPFPTPGVGAGMHARMDALIARAMDKVGPRTPSRPHTPAYSALPAMPVHPMRWPQEDVDAAESAGEIEAEASNHSSQLLTHTLPSSLRSDMADISARSARRGSPAGSVSSRFGVLQWAPETRAHADTYSHARHTPHRDLLDASPSNCNQRTAHAATNAPYDAYAAYDAHDGRDGSRASPQINDVAQHGDNVAHSGMKVEGIDGAAAGIDHSDTRAPQEARLSSPAPPPRPAHTPAAAARSAAPLPSSPGFDSDDDEEYRQLLQQAAASERSLQAHRTPTPSARPTAIEPEDPALGARGQELAVAETNAAPLAESATGVMATPSHPPRPAPPSAPLSTPLLVQPAASLHTPAPHPQSTAAHTLPPTAVSAVAPAAARVPPPPTPSRSTPALARPTDAQAAHSNAPATTAVPSSVVLPTPVPAAASSPTTPSAARPPLPRRPSATEPPAAPPLPTTPRAARAPTPPRTATPLPTPLPSPSHAPSQARSTSTARPAPVLPPRSSSASASRPLALHTDRSHLASRPSAAAATVSSSSTPFPSPSLAPQLRPAASVPPSLPSTPRHTPRPAPTAMPTSTPVPMLPSAFLVTFATHGLTAVPTPDAPLGPARFLVALYSGTAALALAGVTEALPGPHCTFSRAVPLPAMPDANPFLQVKLYTDHPALHTHTSLSQLDAVLRARPPVGSAVMKLSHGVDGLPSATALTAATDDWRARGCPPLTPEQCQLVRGRAPVSLDLISPQLVKLGATVAVTIAPQYGPVSTTTVPLLRAASDGNSNAHYMQSVSSARSTADTATSAATTAAQLTARGRDPTRDAEHNSVRADASLPAPAQTALVPAPTPAPVINTSAAQAHTMRGNTDASSVATAGAAMATAAPVQTPALAAPTLPPSASRPPTPVRPAPPTPARPVTTPTPTPTRPPLPPRSASKPGPAPSHAPAPAPTHPAATAAQPAVELAQSIQRRTAGFTMPPLPGGASALAPRVVFLDTVPAIKHPPTHAAAVHAPVTVSGLTSNTVAAPGPTHAAADPATGLGLGLRISAAPAPVVNSLSAVRTHMHPTAAPAPTVTVLTPSASSPTARRHSSGSATSLADAPKPLSVAVSPSSSGAGYAHAATPRVELSGKTGKPVPAAALSPTNRGEHYPLNVVSHSYGVAGNVGGTSARTLAAERPATQDHPPVRGSHADPAPVTAAAVIDGDADDAVLRVCDDGTAQEAPAAESEVNYDAFIVASPVASPVHGHRSDEHAAGAQPHITSSQRDVVHSVGPSAGAGKPLLPRKPANMSELVEHAAMVELDHYYNDLPLPALPPHAAAGNASTITPAPVPASSPAAVEYADDFDDDYNNFDDTGNDDLFGRPLNNEFFPPPSPHAAAATSDRAASFATTGNTLLFGAPVEVHPPQSAAAAGIAGTGDVVDASMSSALDNSGTSDYNISLFQPQPSAHSSVRPSRGEVGYVALDDGAGDSVSAAGGVKALAAMLGGQRGMYTSGSAAPFGINASGTGSASLNISTASPFKGVRTQNYLSSIDPDADAPLASHGDDVDLSDIEGERARDGTAALDEVGNIQLAGVRRVSVQRRAPTKRASFDWL